MIYQIDDIEFQHISPSEFERLCFEMLLKLGYSQLIWRRGGADNGRDIEAIYKFSTPFMEFNTRWFFECKHYSAGVPPEQLHSKVAWADAEQPDYLIFFISSYLTNNARTWLEYICERKAYKILVIEGPELKHRILQFPDLIELFFASESYLALLADTKRHWLSFRVWPSYDLLWSLAHNIDSNRMTINDLGFLFISLYRQFGYDFEKDDYYNGLNPRVLASLFPRLRTLSTDGPLTLIDKYRSLLDWSNGHGFLDDVENYFPDMEGETDAVFQYNKMHLIPVGNIGTFAIGHYLFFKAPDGSAFELFCIEDSNFTTDVRFYETVSPETVDHVVLAYRSKLIPILKRYAMVFQQGGAF